MRLTSDLRTLATKELLDLIAENPGVRTSALAGAGLPHFHGSRTLSPKQILTLLHACDQVKAYYCGGGRATWIEWKVTP